MRDARGLLWVTPRVLFWKWSVGIVQLMCHNPPDQCKFMCEYLKLQDPSQNGKSCFQIKYDFTILRIVCLTIQWKVPKNNTFMQISVRLPA